VRIELKNVRWSKWASQETECFQASVYINGKRMGQVWNEGTGGPNGYEPHSLEVALDAYGATLPPVICDWPDPTTKSGKAELKQSADILIDNALRHWLLEGDMTKAMTERVLFISRSGQLMQTRKLTVSERDHYIKNPTLLPDAVQVLNGLERSKALELYKAHIS
jgi:hypothetical protein